MATKGSSNAPKKAYAMPSAKTLDGVNLPTSTFKIMFKRRLDDFRLKRGDDILIATFPRTGTTWLGQIVSLLLAKEEEYEQTKKKLLTDRMPYLEYTEFGSDLAEVERLDQFSTPRPVKTHLPYRMIRRWLEEDNVKTIITSRHPKDQLVSLFHFYHAKESFEFDGSWNEFFEHIKAGDQVYGDNYVWLKEWNDKRDKGDFLFLAYEEMKQDMGAQVRKIAKFIGIDLPETRLQQVLHDAGLKQMQADKKVALPTDMKDSARFIRGGYSGEWKKHFTVEQNEWFDNKYKKLYEGLEIPVYYD